MKMLPSILSADFAHLADEVRDVEKDVDLIHVDVMDGQFVPNITMGANVVKALKRETKSLRMRISWWRSRFIYCHAIVGC